MSDKELADKVVALGIGSRLADTYLIDAFSLYPKAFVRDWRVAGALMEKMVEEGVQLTGTWPTDALEAVEACVEALS